MTIREGAPGPARPEGALARLVLRPAEFAAATWGTRPVLTRAAEFAHAGDNGPTAYEDLFGIAAVDELLSRRGLRAPFLRMARDGVTLAERRFTAGAGVGAGIGDQISDDLVLRLFAEGTTIVLQGLHRTWAPLLEFTQSLGTELGHPVQANAYITPPQNRGFADHYDVHDVFVLQIAGEKRWRIRPPVVVNPGRDDPWDRHTDEVAAAATAPPLIEETLRPGDCLYLPRGYLHSATALGGVSVHVTLGVHVWTRRHLLDDLVSYAVRRVLDDPAARASLPVGVEPFDEARLAPWIGAVRESLIAAVAEVGDDELAGALVDRVRGSSRAAPVSPVAQLLASSELDADGAGQRVRLRAGLAARIEGAGDGVVLRSRAGRLPVADDEVEAVRGLFEAGSAETADLGIDLARRLLLGGIVVPGP